MRGEAVCAAQGERWRAGAWCEAARGKANGLGLVLHPFLPPWFQLLSEVKDLWTPILLILACGCHYLNKKVAAFFILGLLFWAHTFGALDLVFNTSLGMRRWSSDHTHGRVLVGINHDTEHEGGDGMISIDLGMTEMNANGSRKDHTALAPWISNQTSDQPVEGYGETTKKQNRTGQPHPTTTNKATKTIVVRWIVIASATFVFVLLCCIVLVLWCKCCRSRVQQIDDPEGQVELGIATGPIKFEYYQLEVATRDFHEDNKLGRGATGFVYQGHLRSLDSHVAIKVMSLSKRLNDFNSEVEVITQLKHKNIVELVGWCRTNEKLLLVYELMAKGSLYKNLYNRGEILSWEQRYKIILDLGNALTYLHVCCNEFIFHGDIKPENVLLDASYNAKLGDFGTTRLIQNGTADPQPTENVPGTRGYLDPVFLNIGLRCPEAEVYGFGVVLLEIACAKRPVWRLVAWVRELYDQSKAFQEPSRILHAADERLNGEFDQQQMERVLVTGLWCAHQDPSQRPSIVQAMDVLRSAEGNLPLVPAVLGPQDIRSMERLAYGESSSFGDSVPASSYHTCNDSAYLLAGG
ncbi:hypothetical protein BS78_05G174800 [Paspalum vaginatum]|nr:hypothetical protein BS78_05G174800 [Paspalum vaginatum]